MGSVLSKIKGPLVTVLLGLTIFSVQAKTHVNVNVNLGDPGYFGAVPPMPGYTPRVWNTNPVVAIGATIAGVTALYLNVPNTHRKNWSRYCGRYDACDKPVHFLQGNWYRKVYAPQYRKQHRPGNPNPPHWNGRHAPNHSMMGQPPGHMQPQRPHARPQPGGRAPEGRGPGGDRGGRGPQHMPPHGR
ncbi:MAG: hypothetical protein IJ022_02025 [Burkholderiaceae bacterium]|nr:hypothetical protein [Burkholderiaceae bacterium]